MDHKDFFILQHGQLHHKSRLIRSSDDMQLHLVALGQHLHPDDRKWINEKHQLGTHKVRYSPNLSIIPKDTHQKLQSIKQSAAALNHKIKWDRARVERAANVDTEADAGDTDIANIVSHVNVRGKDQHNNDWRVIYDEGYGHDLILNNEPFSHSTSHFSHMHREWYKSRGSKYPDVSKELTAHKDPTKEYQACPACDTLEFLHDNSKAYSK